MKAEQDNLPPILDLAHGEKISWNEALLRTIDDRIVGREMAERMGLTTDDEDFDRVVQIYAERETGRRAGEARIEARVKAERESTSAKRRKAGKLGAKVSGFVRGNDKRKDAIMREVRRKLNDNANKLSANAIIRQVSRAHIGDNGLPIMSEAAIKKRLQRGKNEKRGKYKREAKPKK